MSEICGHLTREPLLTRWCIKRPQLRGSVARRENFSQASLMAGCLGDGPARCVREFPRCGPNGIGVETVTVNFPHPVGLPDVGLESAPVRG